ncbi:MAG: hypothetical protein WC656_01725 [Sulfurimonas sp.]|jgi:molybdenum cofactor biosynthesis enzyme
MKKYTSIIGSMLSVALLSTGCVQAQPTPSGDSHNVAEATGSKQEIQAKAIALLIRKVDALEVATTSIQSSNLQVKVKTRVKTEEETGITKPLEMQIQSDTKYDKTIKDFAEKGIKND